MPKKYTRNTHVFSQAFDAICSSFGPDSEANKVVAKILCRHVRSIRDWRSGLQPCPRWAYDLVRLTIKERNDRLQEMFGSVMSRRRSYVFNMTRLSSVLDRDFGTLSANDACSVVDISSEM